jgi:hypothetical protein
MRFTKQIIEQMKELIEPHDTLERSEAYVNGNIPRYELVKDINRRYRFDLYYATRAWRAIPDGFKHTDEHLHTALKTFIPDLRPQSVVLASIAPNTNASTQ